MTVRGRKVGVYIPEDIEKALRSLAGGGELRNISRVVQEALRLYLSETLGEKCEAAGFVNVLYDHESGGVDTALTDIQHDYMDIVVFANHVHIDKKRCLLSIAVRGGSARIGELMSRIRSIRGVLLLKPTLLCVEV